MLVGIHLLAGVMTGVPTHLTSDLYLTYGAQVFVFVLAVGGSIIPMLNASIRRDGVRQCRPHHSIGGLPYETTTRHHHHPHRTHPDRRLVGSVLLVGGLIGVAFLYEWLRLHWAW